MKQITTREFARLCRSDPSLYEQTIAIPKTITAEKLLSLAARNGYSIVPERKAQPEEPGTPLDDEMLDSVSGGAMSRQEKLDALHTWLYYVMGFGEKQQD